MKRSAALLVTLFLATGEAWDARVEGAAVLLLTGGRAMLGAGLVA